MQYIMHALVSFLHYCVHALLFNISTKNIDFITQKEKNWKRTSNNKDNLWEKNNWLLHMSAPGALDDNLSCLCCLKHSHGMQAVRKI